MVIWMRKSIWSILKILDYLAKKKVWQLYKVLYSLKQASLSWWQTITKSKSALGFKQCKSNAGVYYFINKETRELITAIVYINDVYFMSSKDFLLFLELKQKFMTKWKFCNLGETKDFSSGCKNLHTDGPPTIPLIFHCCFLSALHWSIYHR